MLRTDYNCDGHGGWTVPTLSYLHAIGARGRCRRHWPSDRGEECSDAAGHAAGVATLDEISVHGPGCRSPKPKPPSTPWARAHKRRHSAMAAAATAGPTTPRRALRCAHRPHRWR